MKILIASIFLLCGSALMSGQTTQKLTADKTNEYGLIYTLPTTQIDITVAVERTIKHPGQFHNYAKKYLNISDVVTRDEESVKVTGVILNAEGVSDPDKRYLVQFKSGSTPYITLNSQNCPLNVNTEEIHISTYASLPEPPENIPDPLATDAARQAVTQEMIQSSSIAKKAELAAARIYELREARNEIISGRSDQSFPDGKALQLALDNLSAQEAALTAMFVGTVTVTYENQTFSFIPERNSFTNKVLTRISPLTGFVASNNLSGEPVYLSMKIDELGKLPVNEKGVEKTFPKGGLAYIIPGKATFTVSFGGKTLLTESFELAQLGVTFGVDPSLFTDKKAPAYAVFNPVTGAIVNLGTK